MTRRIVPLFILLVLCGCHRSPTSGEIDKVAAEMTWLMSENSFRGLPSMMVNHDGFILYCDPVRPPAGTPLPPADLILVTHDDRDHFNRQTLEQLRKEGTVLITNKNVARYLEGSWDPRYLYVVTPGDQVIVGDVAVEVVPMYREFNTRLHPKRSGFTGYIVDFDHVRVYFSGSIGVMPELVNMKNIHIACLNVRGQGLPIPGEPYLESTGGDSYTLDEKETLVVLEIIKPAVFFPNYWRKNQREAIENLAAEVPPEIRVIIAPPF
jgi:L-ascorbate metabolism protein UlaG (beta-lactamase superfamily)